MWYFISLACLCLGIALHKLKLYERIIGYNKMSVEDQEDSHAQSISKYFAFISYTFSALALIIIITQLLGFQKVYDALYVLVFIMVFAVIMDAPRYIRMLKDEEAQPLKISKKKYMKMVRYLSFVGILVAFFIYLLFR